MYQLDDLRRELAELAEAVPAEPAANARAGVRRRVRRSRQRVAITGALLACASVAAVGTVVAGTLRGGDPDLLGTGGSAPPTTDERDGRTGGTASAHPDPPTTTGGAPGGPGAPPVTVADDTRSTPDVPRSTGPAGASLPTTTVGTPRTPTTVAAVDTTTPPPASTDAVPIDTAPTTVAWGVDPVIVESARRRVAAWTVTPLDRVSVVDAQPHVWSDYSIGCAQPTELYQQATLPGARILVAVAPPPESAAPERRVLVHQGNERYLVCEPERRIELAPGFGQPSDSQTCFDEACFEQALRAGSAAWIEVQDPDEPPASTVTARYVTGVDTFIRSITRVTADGVTIEIASCSFTNEADGSLCDIVLTL